MCQKKQEIGALQEHFRRTVVSPPDKTLCLSPLARVKKHFLFMSHQQLLF
jgi:hypothetical protein